MAAVMKKQSAGRADMGEGSRVLIIDAGGGTIDITMHTIVMKVSASVHQRCR